MSTGNTVYGYFRATVPSGKVSALPQGGTGFVCVRLDRPPKNTGEVQYYRASFSFCSPADAPKKNLRVRLDGSEADTPQPAPCKALSRRIADSRMNTTRVKAHIEFPFLRTPETKLPEIFTTALGYAKGNSHKGRPLAPDWFMAAEKVEYGWR